MMNTDPHDPQVHTAAEVDRMIVENRTAEAEGPRIAERRSAQAVRRERLILGCVSGVLIAAGAAFIIALCMDAVHFVNTAGSLAVLLAVPAVVAGSVAAGAVVLTQITLMFIFHARRMPILLNLLISLPAGPLLIWAIFAIPGLIHG